MREIPGQPVSRFGAFVTIVVTGALLVWFNFFPQYVGFISNLSGPWSVYPVLLPEFDRYQVGLNLWWIAGIMLNIVHLATGRWFFTTWLGDVLLKLYGVFLFMAMVIGPTFITPTWLSPIIKIVLALTAFGLTVGIIAQVVGFARATFRHHPAPPDAPGPAQNG